MSRHSLPSLQYVLFFRAANVGGHRIFQPSKLAKDLAQFDVANIGAAGTFVVRKASNEQVLRQEILKRLPFQPELIVCPAGEVLALAKTEAFRNRPLKGDAQQFLSVLKESPATILQLPLEYPAGRRWEVKIVAIAGRFVFSLRRPGKTYSNTVVEKHLGIPATTRNWNTLTAIWKLLNTSAN